MARKQRVLVIANRTADSPELIAALNGGREGDRFTLLVPAVPRGLAWAADMKAGWTEAIGRAEAAGGRLRLAGIDLEGVIVGDPDPFAAAGDALHAGGYDAVVVSTLPRSLSRWLRLSLPDRMRRAFDLPVTHVTAHPRSRGSMTRARQSSAASV